MKRDNINYLIVGLFVLAVGAAFFAVMFEITGRTGPADEYHIYYRNVAGLKFGTPVYFEGFQAGQVESIDPERHSGQVRYRVTVAIRKRSGWSWQIPTDSVAKITSTGLLSAKAIDIQEGEETDYIALGGEIPGRPEVNIMAAINEAAADFHDLAGAIKPLITNLENRITGLIDDFSDVTNEELRPLLRKARERIDSPELFEKVDSLLVSLNTSSGHIEALLGNRNQEYVTGILTQVNEAAGNLNVVIRNIEGTRANMHQVLDHLNELVSENREDVRESMINMRATLEVIARHIDAISHNLENSSRNMNEFTRQIRENPGLILGSSPQEDKQGKRK